ncbi:MAG: type IV pilin protein [Saccharofermentanales bacterium]
MGICGKKKKGFTLIELIVVIAILAILAAVTIPNLMVLAENAETAAEIAAAAEYAGAINVYNHMNPVKIADRTQGNLLSADVDDELGSELTPITDIADIQTYVLARITVSSGIATVTNKDDIS